MPDTDETQDKTETPKQAEETLSAEAKDDEALTHEQLDDVAGAGIGYTVGGGGGGS